MTDQIKFNLPKVRIRIKTEPIQLPQPREPLSFKQYQAAPLVFQERQKMKKQIQQSYFKFRRMKKNNYLRQFSSKKHNTIVEQKRMVSISVKDEVESKKSIQFALEAEAHSKRDIQSYKLSKQRQKLFSSLIHDKPNTHRQMSAENINSIRQVSLIKHSSLHQSCLQLLEDPSIQLEGKKCHYSPERSSKNRIIDLKSHKKVGHHLLKTKINRMSSFSIDPWKDNSSPMQLQLQEQPF